MKYRHNLTNAGIIGGFANVTPDGKLHIHQNAFTQSALTLELPADIAGPEYPFQLVSVLYQIIPTEDVEKPLCRVTCLIPLAKELLPRSVDWKARDFVCDLDFYPFGERYGRFSEDVLAPLPDAPQYPQWVLDEAARDESFANMVSKPIRKQLPNRALVTCYLRSTGRLSLETIPLRHPSRLIADAIVPNGDKQEIFRVELSHGCQGYHMIASTKPNGPGVPCTVLLKHDFDSELDEDGNLVSYHDFFRVIEILSVDECDQLEDNEDALERSSC